MINKTVPPEIPLVNNESNNHSVPQSFAVKTYKHAHKEDNYEESVDMEKIPLYMWKNKHLSKDHIACLTQNVGDFRYIPLNDLLVYNGPHVSCQKIPDILQAHNTIQHSGVPNFWKARIPVATQLNPDRWAFYLQDYWDKQLPDLIKYGFPLDFDTNLSYSQLMTIMLQQFNIVIKLTTTYLRS